MLSFKSKYKDETDSICCICLETLHDTNINRMEYEKMNRIVLFLCKKNSKTVLPCGHAFHSSCIRKWMSIRHTCPLCRRKVKRKNSNSKMVDKTRFLFIIPWICTSSVLPLFLYRGESLLSVWLLLCVFPSFLTVLSGIALISYEVSQCNLSTLDQILLFIILVFNTVIVFTKQKNTTQDTDCLDLV